MTEQAEPFSILESVTMTEWSDVKPRAIAPLTGYELFAAWLSDESHIVRGYD